MGDSGARKSGSQTPSPDTVDRVIGEMAGNSNGEGALDYDPPREGLSDSQLGRYARFYQEVVREEIHRLLAGGITLLPEDQERIVTAVSGKLLLVDDASVKQQVLAGEQEVSISPSETRAKQLVRFVIRMILEGEWSPLGLEGKIADLDWGRVIAEAGK